MSVATYAALVAKMTSPTQQISYMKGAGTPVGSNWDSAWLGVGSPVAYAPGVNGVAPSAPAIPTNATAGALGQANKIGTEQRLFLRRYRCGIAVTNSGAGLMIVDRLAHMGGLDGTNVGVQAVNTPALTRYTTGVDVFAGIEVYTSLGATSTTMTMTYTNQAGVGGQVSPPVVISGMSAGRIIPFALALGDYGVQSVQSVQLAGTTGVIGNFGITLYKPLGMLPQLAGAFVHGGAIPQTYLPMPAVVDGACLQPLIFTNLSGGNSSNLIAEFGFFED